MLHSSVEMVVHTLMVLQPGGEMVDHTLMVLQPGGEMGALHLDGVGHAQTKD